MSPFKIDMSDVGEGFDPILENRSVTFSSLSTSRASSLVIGISGYLF